MARIPLWIDATLADDSAPIVAAANAVHAEIVIGGNAAREGDDIVADDVAIATVMTMADAKEQDAAAAAPGRIVIDAADWAIIPLENLIAARRDRPDSLYAFAASAEECGVFRDTLEVGVHGVVLRATNADEVHAAHALLESKGPRPDDRPDAASEEAFVQIGRVTAVQDAGPGDRVCIDTTSMFDDGEGLLIGSTARGFALIHAETVASQFVATRPFRVNAGAIHSYLLGPDGRTSYLSEAKSGQQVMAVGRDGSKRTLTIGRAKIERRPHTLVHWESEQGFGQVIVQTAETIRFSTPDGYIPVTQLKAGDEILVHGETTARHFGMAVHEKLVER